MKNIFCRKIFLKKSERKNLVMYFLYIRESQIKKFSRKKFLREILIYIRENHKEKFLRINFYREKYNREKDIYIIERTK